MRDGAIFCDCCICVVHFLSFVGELPCFDGGVHAHRYDVFLILGKEDSGDGLWVCIFRMWNIFYFIVRGELGDKDLERVGSTKGDMNSGVDVLFWWGWEEGYRSEVHVSRLEDCEECDGFLVQQS